MLLIESGLDGRTAEAKMTRLDSGLQAVREYHRALVQKIVVDGRAYVLAPVFTDSTDVLGQQEMKVRQEQAIRLLFGEGDRRQCE